MGEYEAVLYSKEGSFLSPAKNVAVIKLNRVDALNSINDQFLADLVAALDEAENDPEVRSVVIASAHDKVYCTGADLKMAQGFLGKPDEVKPLLEEGQAAIDKIAKL
ncbi:MAG: enoyl-CoA hydratase/isomerase family protein, partial [Candidatus Thorarchaeota archaeon]|nr:enoyl-CoA hydratase/isomerase family protein [Candidatus Thorarchaeota archaeon]